MSRGTGCLAGTSIFFCFLGISVYFRLDVKNL